MVGKVKNFIWSLLSNFRANKNFSGNHAFVAFLFLDFCCCAELPKKLQNRFQEDVPMNRNMDTQKSMYS